MFTLQLIPRPTNMKRDDSTEEIKGDISTEGIKGDIYGGVSLEEYHHLLKDQKSRLEMQVELNESSQGEVLTEVLDSITELGLELQYIEDKMKKR